jgi:hypothetical protein
MSRRRLQLTGEYPDELESPFVAILLKRIRQTRRLWASWLTVASPLLWLLAAFSVGSWVHNSTQEPASVPLQVAVFVGIIATLVFFAVFEIAALNVTSSVVMRSESLRSPVRILQELFKAKPDRAIAIGIFDIHNPDRGVNLSIGFQGRLANSDPNSAY